MPGPPPHRREAVLLRLFALAGLVVALVGVSPASARRSAHTFLTGKVPAGQTVADLRNQQFVEQVACTRGCDVTTIASIALADARRLGFKGQAPAEPWVEIASSYIRLKANTPTAVHLVLTPQGRKLLAKATGNVRVVGRLLAHPSANHRAVGRAQWSVALK